MLAKRASSMTIERISYPFYIYLFYLPVAGRINWRKKKYILMTGAEASPVPDLRPPLDFFLAVSGIVAPYDFI
jgi:hypothetical protein